MRRLVADTYYNYNSSEPELRLRQGVLYLEIPEAVIDWLNLINARGKLTDVHYFKVEEGALWRVEPSRYNPEDVFVANGVKAIWVTKKQFNEFVNSVPMGTCADPAVVDFETDWDVL